MPSPNQPKETAHFVPNHTSPLHRYVYERICAEFGKPKNTMEKDYHWALPPLSASSMAINVLVNGTVAKPAVWVFDPHHAENVFKTMVRDEEHAEEIIKLLLGRVSGIQFGQSEQTAS